MVDDAGEMRRIIGDLVVELEDEIGLFVGLKGGKVAVDTANFDRALQRKRLHSKNTTDHAAISLLEDEQGGGLVQVRGTMAKGRAGLAPNAVRVFDNAQSVRKCVRVRFGMCSAPWECSVRVRFGLRVRVHIRKKKRHIFFLKCAFVR